MTSVVFETATLADSVRKAAAIAPAKAGDSFDKAAGLMLEIYPDHDQVILRATDLLLYYMEWLDPLEASGEPVRWRLPSKVFEAIISSLPIGSGKTVVLTQENSTLKISSGRTRASVRLIRVQDYPSWYPFETDGLKVVSDIGARIAQAEWAADKSVPAFGIRLTGTHVFATDKYRLVSVPLDLDTPEAITIPPSVLTQLLKKVGETRIGIDDTHLLVMPDDHTQVKAVRIGEKFPPIERVMIRDHPNQIKCRRNELVEIINRATKIGADRFPVLRLIIGKEEFATFMAEEELGHIGDVLEIPGQATHARIEIRMHPQNLLDALTNSPSEEVIFHYDPDSPKKKLVRIDGGSGYEVWLAPRGDVPKSEE